jgi:hypothetical protein
MRQKKSHTYMRDFFDQQVLISVDAHIQLGNFYFHDSASPDVPTRINIESIFIIIFDDSLLTNNASKIID